MDIGSIVQHLLANSITASTIYGLCLLFVVDFATGVAAAWRDKTFDVAYIDSWAREKGSRLVIILIVLIAGAAAPNLDVLGFSINPLTTLAVGWAATVAATELNSIKDNFDKNAPNPPPDPAG